MYILLPLLVGITISGIAFLLFKMAADGSGFAGLVLLPLGGLIVAPVVAGFAITLMRLVKLSLSKKSKS